MSDVFSIINPDNVPPLPLILDSPHSGAIYPADFNHAAPCADLQKAEDKYVDELFINVPDHGGYFLRAHFPRSYIDPNRAIDDIDPALMENDWPFGTINPTARSDSGIGLIRRLLSPGTPLYNRPLTPKEIQHRIQTYYTPYHDALENLLNEAQYNFGQVYHINCHSMPASSATPKKAMTLVGNQLRPSDIVLSNRDGTTCGTAFIHTCRDFFKAQGLTTTLNDPFKGAELIQRHGHPARNRHSLQIEINKALYMNEQTCEKTNDFKKIQNTMNDFIAHCAEYAQSQLIDLAAD